ncbi:hypothetical protein Tco_1169700, partial [Tanacetum coccineum]
IGSVRVRPCEVKFLLITLNTQLKIFHTSLDDNSLCCKCIELSALLTSMRDTPEGEFVVFDDRLTPHRILVYGARNRGKCFSILIGLLEFGEVVF